MLHDGTTIIIERLCHLGSKPTLDRHEQQDLDETVSFMLPGSNKKITWKTDFRDSEPEPNSLNLLLLDIVKGIPYIAAYPAGCIAYNKWNRPNPPYIFFKYENKNWRQITLEEFPVLLRKGNVIIGRSPAKLQKPFYTVEQVKEENRYVDEKYKTIARTPLKGVGCRELVTDGNGTWLSIFKFKDQPSYEACLNICNREKFDAEHCPCNKLFKTNSKEK